MNSDVAFFYEHAGFSYDPKTETPEQGNLRGAEALAAAEARGRDEGLSFEWDIDPDVDSSSFSGARPSWSLWCCQAYDADGEKVASLWGCDFGRGGTPYGDAYRRVVEAELALEYLA